MDMLMKQAVDDNKLFPFKNFKLCGVVARPNFKANFDISGFSYVTMKQDQYQVILDPNIF